MSQDKIVQVSLHNVLADDYVGYALSTLGRSMPNAIDGLKVSQRRLLQTAFEEGLNAGKPFRKLSLLAGVNAGHYHPHGEASGAVVNMADNTDYLQPLFSIHGNIGGGDQISRKKLSADGAAASRYLESRLSAFAEAVFDVPLDFLPVRPNYDNSRQEIVYYVPALPLALVNGQTGIGTGYATNTFGFRLQAIAKAIACATANAPAETIAKAIGIPDFPAAFAIQPDEGLIQLQESGHGTFAGIGRYEFADTELQDRKRNKYRRTIVIKSLPEGSAEKFCDKVRDAVQAGKLQGITQVNDYSSSKSGLHVEVVLDAGVQPKEVIGGLLSHTNLRSTFSANYTLEHKFLPKQFTPAELLTLWLDAREEVLAKMYANKLAEEQATINRLSTLLKAIDKIDEVISIIRRSESKQRAASELALLLDVNEEQANMVLCISLGQLVRTSANELALQMQKAQTSAKVLAKFVGTSAEARCARLGEIARKAESLAKEFGLERFCQLSQTKEQIHASHADAKTLPAKHAQKHVFADAPRAVQDAWTEADSLPYPFTLSQFKSWLKKTNSANAKEFVKAWQIRKAEHLLWWHTNEPKPEVTDKDVQKFLPGLSTKNLKQIKEAKGKRGFFKLITKVL